MGEGGVNLETDDVTFHNRANKLTNTMGRRDSSKAEERKY